MTIARRLEELEVNKKPELHDIEHGYLKRFCTEQGIDPTIYPRTPDEALGDIQTAWRKKFDKTTT